MFLYVVLVDVLRTPCEVAFFLHSLTSHLATHIVLFMTHLILEAVRNSYGVFMDRVTSQKVSDVASSRLCQYLIMTSYIHCFWVPLIISHT